MVLKFHVHTGEHVDDSVMLVLVVCIVSVHVLDAGCIVFVTSVTIESTIKIVVTAWCMQ